MELDQTALYQAVCARDRRFDGWFYVGVTSTGIYCRPVCAVRTPQARNCQFFDTQAAAEKAGFRPCLRCRPELAPGLGVLDVSKRLAHAAASLIDEGFLANTDLAALAERVGVSERHLRRIFLAEFGVTPVEYAQTQRLLLAKRLLTDTSMELSEIAYAAGFGSVRRFNSLFLSRYRLAPGRFRKATDDKGPGTRDSGGNGNARDPSGNIRFELAYRPPYAWDAVLGFLAHRQIEGVESIEHSCYRRVVSFEGPQGVCTGWVEVRNLPGRSAVEVVMSTALSSVVPAVLAGMRRVFDLNCRPDIIDPVLGELAADLPGMRVPGAVDGFEIAVRAVIGQQISVLHARKILARFSEAFGRRLDDDQATDVQAADDKPTDGIAASRRPRLAVVKVAAGARVDGSADAETAISSPVRVAFPTAASFAEAGVERLREVGALTQARAQTLHALAVEVASERLRLAPLEPLEPTINGLLAIKGIGDWTAQYVAMRALSWPNAFPAGDLIIRKQLGVETAAEATEIATQWAPWRGYAIVHLWRHFERAKQALADAKAATLVAKPRRARVKSVSASAEQIQRDASDIATEAKLRKARGTRTSAQAEQVQPDAPDPASTARARRVRGAGSKSSHEQEDTHA
ncbi:AraC family transcriptional regulator, regulatory protein of adaptative response / DNA-3-methyladenine glycosylase II [Pararobbsia alpina]|uniref:DNA-3-methyladenine glycosylase 2 family protein n=1 Tax=Pararobbsia alpina TaxID=621374 RepID=UPI0039A56465